MQPVDVLGDDGADLAAPHQRVDGAVAAIGLGAAESVLHRKAAPPGLAPRLLGGEELVEIDRRHLRPDAAGAAEIGDAGFGADAGAGEHDGAARLGDQAGERGDLGCRMSCRYFGKARSRRQARPQLGYAERSRQPREADDPLAGFARAAPRGRISAMRR